jgi:hypothetical protein
MQSPKSTGRTHFINSARGKFPGDPSGAFPTAFDQRLGALMERQYRPAEDFQSPFEDENELARKLVLELNDEAKADTADSR